MKIIVGSTWKAKMAPELSVIRSPNRPELGSPSSPKRILVPAKVADSIFVTTPPAHDMALRPQPKRSTRKANVICSPRPQKMVRQRMRLRSVENSHAASRTARIPNTPVNRAKRLLLQGRKGFPKNFRLIYSISQAFLGIFSRDGAAYQRHRSRR